MKIVHSYKKMDGTTKKLIEAIEDLDRKMSTLRRDRDAAYTALALAGIRPRVQGPLQIPSRLESDYRGHRPFAEMSLSRACLKVLKDHKGDWLTKSNVEYLVVRGGYKFDTDNPANSVGITLSRLADQEVGVEVQRIRGSKGSTYRYVKTTERTGGEADSDTAS
jgi:hypothetical protein